MNTYKWKLGAVIAALGLIGVLSLHLSDLPLDNLPPEVLEQVSIARLKWLILINPAILVLLSTALGVALYRRVGFRVPVIENYLGDHTHSYSWRDILRTGALFGAAAGLLIVVVQLVLKPFLPAVLFNTEAIDLHVLTRFLYGGITEEILLRFGFMTLVVWLLAKLFRGVSPRVYWAGIIVSAVVFAIGHLPVVYQAVGYVNPIIVTYIILANSLGGVLFGYTYWKNGLESAWVAHAMAHVVMLALGALVLLWAM